MYGVWLVFRLFSITVFTHCMICGGDSSASNAYGRIFNPITRAVMATTDPYDFKNRTASVIP
jgi:hypothetical protein